MLTYYDKCNSVPTETELSKGQHRVAVSNNPI